MPDHEELLARHKPVLKHDSHEAYFADSAAEWTDNPANRLNRADGSLIASASPAHGEQRLRLGFLGKERYADNEELVPPQRRNRRNQSRNAPA
jgi:hypothetical protein